MQQAPTKTQQGQPQYVITDADKARQQAIAEAWKAFKGEFDKPLKPMEDEADDNVIENHCKPIVRSGVEFLFGKELEISVEEGAPQEAQDLLDSVWGRKEKRMPLLQDVAYNGALAGNGFLRIMPGKGKKKTFRLVAIDPSIVFVQTAPQDCETALLFCIEYSTPGQAPGQEVYYREEIARIDPDDDGDDGDPFADTDATWQIQHWTRIGDRGAWTAAGKPITWAYPFPPIFTTKNLPMPNSFWGEADITPDLIGLNNALNLTESNINRSCKIYGNPLMYSIGVGEGGIDHTPGKIVNLPTLEGKITAVAIVSDIANMRAHAADLRSSFDELSGTPGVATGRLEAMPRGDMSGIAIELLYMPELKKTDGKQMRYGDLIIDISKALLVLSGMSGDIDITLAWQSALPHDDLPSAQAAVAKKGLGISNATLQRELGYDPDEEMELSQSEDAQKLANFMKGQGMPPMMPGQPVAPGQQPPNAVQPPVQSKQVNPTQPGD